MKAGAKKRNLWIEAAVVALLLALAVTAFVRSEMKPLTADELKIDASDLRSLSSSGAQLQHQYPRGTLTAAFFRTQASLLRDNVKSTRESLESARPEPDVEAELAKIRALAGQLEEAYNTLVDGSAGAGQTEGTMKDLVASFKSLEEALKQKAQNK
jgi:hypothetical protein